MKGIVFYTVCGCLLVAGGISGSLDEPAKSHDVPVFESRVYSESPEIPCYTEDEKVFYGLLPDTEERAGERVVSVGSTISNFNTVHLSDAAGRYKWTSEFAEWLELRRSIISNIGYVQMLPFNTQKITSVAWENSNQGNYNSCATFGFTNAYYATVNYNIALESGQYYKDFNPMFLYRNTSGGSGGRTLSEIVAFNVESGQASTDKVGRYPSLSGTDEFAKERRRSASKSTTSRR
ncbi:hypothetical protein FACS18942_05040 [Planctomycetales bacterium]|nr:hypothetical protein FACS18942_05040 [Planctomycetales bacterium]GHT37032.1 hypothetical protein FACS189427_09490 [Planctomycetales bacterium]